MNIPRRLAIGPMIIPLDLVSNIESSFRISQNTAFRQFSGYRIISSVRKRIASENSPQSKQPSLESAVFFHCFQSVLGACGNIRAFRALKRREIFLVEFNQPYHCFFCHRFQPFPPNAEARPLSCATIEHLLMQSITFADQSCDPVSDDAVSHLLAH